MTLYDVAIVGAGPAGSSLAIRLADQGFNVLLLEKHRFPRDKTCGDLVSPKGLTILDALGCLEPINKRDYVPLTEARTMLDGKWLSRGRIPYRPGMLDHAHAVPRIVLDEIIFRRAQQVGASTAEAVEVKGLTFDKDRIRVSAEQANKSVTYETRLVVGADGPHSVVARQVGMGMTDQRYMEFAMRAYCHGLPIRESIMLFEEEFFPGFGWVFPVSNRLANVGVGVVAESSKKFGVDLRLFFDRLIKRLLCWAADEGWHIEVEKPTGWPIKTYGGTHRNFFERGLLIGEAGCFVDPINGEGIPLALESAALAAETISAAFKQGDFSHDMLSQYEQRWRSAFEPNLGTSDLVVSMIRNRYLSKLWIELLELCCKTAEAESDYAWKMGGILAGTVPIREGLRPEVALRPLLHAMQDCTNPFSASHLHLPNVISRAIKFGLWEVSLLSDIARDYQWFVNWCREVNEKQRLVIADRRTLNYELGV